MENLRLENKQIGALKGSWLDVTLKGAFFGDLRGQARDLSAELVVGEQLHLTGFEEARIKASRFATLELTGGSGSSFVEVPPGLIMQTRITLDDVEVAQRAGLHAGDSSHSILINGLSCPKLTASAPKFDMTRSRVKDLTLMAHTFSVISEHNLQKVAIQDSRKGLIKAPYISELSTTGGLLNLEDVGAIGSLVLAGNLPTPIILQLGHNTQIEHLQIRCPAALQTKNGSPLTVERLSLDGDLLFKGHLILTGLGEFKNACKYTGGTLTVKRTLRASNTLFGATQLILKAGSEATLFGSSFEEGARLQRSPGATLMGFLPGLDITETSEEPLEMRLDGPETFIEGITFPNGTQV